MNQSTEPIRIGQILIDLGILREQQVFEILQLQKQRSIPFGVLAERHYDVTSESIEQAWIEQYHRFTGTIDLDDEIIDEQALTVINRRQAWQFEILPLRVEPSGELIIAASKTRLARAVTFVASRVQPVVYFRIVKRDQLRTYLQKYYAMPEVPAEILRKAKMLASQPTHY